MSRRCLLFLVCLGCTLPFISTGSNARFELRVDEKASRIFLRNLAPEVSLAIENGSRESIKARVRLELINTDNVVSASTENKFDLRSGSQKLLITLPFKTRDLSPNEESKILWYRLHYRVTPDAASGASPSEGFVSLSEITPDLFELRIVQPRRAIPGKQFTSKVLARHPVTHRPLKDVALKGMITISGDGDDDVSLTSSAVTNSAGYADLSFNLPAELPDDEFELEVEGTRGLVTVKAEHDGDTFDQPYLFISTDKPLYQPGQTLHARLLMLGPSKHAAADKEVEFKIKDPEGTVVAGSVLTTSRFGIASAEWQIPDSTRLGDYELEFTTDNDDHSVNSVVKVSRYDLPTFSVNVKTDRTYYLPGQNAAVEIKADYLFGKPVTKGHVRLVRETERTWNYREQKYETTEGDKYEGETQADGVFKAQINLTNDHNELAGEDYSRFSDLSYAAYLTDPTTKRTEQRRFNIRLSKEAIHIYVIRPQDSYDENRKLPLRFYVSTCYADGTPVPASLTIRVANHDGPKTIARTRTNRYGLTRIDQLQIAPTLQDTSLDLELLAQDKTGSSGAHKETFTLTDNPVVRVDTSKTLFAVGDPIEATITASKPNLSLIVNVSHDGATLYSQPLRLRDGRASVLIPYQRDFKDEMTISAYAEVGDDDDSEDLTWGAHTILYPRKRDLNLNVQTAHTYKPGEQAHVTFRSTNPDGRSIETALGVVVTDRAVDERVRTDQEFGSRYSSFASNVLSMLGYGEAIGGLTRKSLDQINASKPIPADLALAAEVILNQGHDFNAVVFGGDDYDINPASVFQSLIQQQLKPLANALNKNYERNMSYPRSESSLQQILSNSGLSFTALRDPWGVPYRASFDVEKQLDVFSIQSAGPDKRFSTSDDFEATRLTWNYFQPIGQAIDSLTREYHHTTGSYIRDFATLVTELRKKNFDLNSIRDPWHNPFKITFEVAGTNLQIRITSIEPAATSADAEFLVWLSTIDYFAEHRSRIDLALDKCLRETGSYPANETELHDTLLAAGIDTTKLLDPWNQSYYFVFQSQLFYGDRVTLEARAVYNQPTTQQLRVIPVTKTARTIRIKSAGADGTIGTPDDFELASFNATLAEQSGTDTEPRRVSAPVSFSGSTGAITGVVMDAVGASVPGTQVTAKPQTTEQVFEATSDDTGKYLIRNLPAGVYEVRASSPGFKDMVVSQVVVRSSELIHLNFTLEVGAVAETVTVTSGAATVNVTSASISELKVDGLRNLLLLAPGVAAAKQQLSTPRVREYFPETLLWQPQLTTDKKGRAQLDFKLADNITTWKMSVIGSTEDGEIGLAETDIRAFQPFFAELDPPRILTQGDRISLPVVLRNYLDKKQSVDVILKPETWFKILDTNQKQIEVPAGEARNAVFNLQAVTAIENGKQQISALASDFSDAIEKPVSVHPDGEERAETTSDVLERATSLNINLPLNTIPQSARVELKLYPNLMTHVWESVEGIMKRPYGCGEQTISSTYPSLMMLRYLKSEKTDSPIASKASKYVDLGYQRLLGYQSTSGGFTYWGHGDADIALTAYAIRFLHDVAEVKSIDDSAAENARRWLITQQRQDGSWAALDWNHKEDVRRSAVLTALVARSLAVTEPKGYPAANSSLTKALAYLDSRGNAFDEPYLIASYALASSLAGLEDQAHRANSKLRELAKTEGPRSYWALETNTPFYGWGLAGRIETTALAVQALANESTSADEFRNLRTRGLLFLIQNQDRYGVWYSTQATVNVLDAMLSVLSTSARELGVSQSIDVTVNGKMIEHVSLPTDKRLLAPVSIDLSSEIKPNSNVIELRRTGSGSPVGLQVVTTYYVPWLSDVEASRDRVSNAERLKLATSYDKHDAAIGSEITCHVKAERVGLQGYGMLLAEIGLPPGVDVDRASLETAMRGSDWSISQYDVLPDRVVIYLWPRAGGSEFSFKFRPRLAVTAKASASSLYDYYNPEAKAMVAPGTFVVR